MAAVTISRCLEILYLTSHIMQMCIMQMWKLKPEMEQFPQTSPSEWFDQVNRQTSWTLLCEA